MRHHKSGKPIAGDAGNASDFIALHQMRSASGQSQQDAQITEACARVIAEEGEQDYARATRKALARLGLPDNTRHPRHADITVALNQYLALFQANSQPEALHRLRLEARGVLRLLERALPDCAPVLKGAVALGHANAFSAIEIELVVEDYKTLDFFLFDHEIETRIEADGNYHGERQVEGSGKTNRVIYHVLHAVCDVKFRPLLRANMSSKRAQRSAQKMPLENAHEAPYYGHLQPMLGQQNDAIYRANVVSKNAMTLQELEALLNAEIALPGS